MDPHFRGGDDKCTEFTACLEPLGFGTMMQYHQQCWITHKWWGGVQHPGAIDLLRKSPKLILMVTEHALKNNKQFQVVLTGVSIILIYPIFLWWFPILSMYIPRMALADSADPLFSFAVSALDICEIVVRWLCGIIVYPMAVFYILWMAFISVAGFRRRRRKIISIIQMYLEIVLVFTVLYFYLSLWSPSEGDPIIHGIAFLGTNLEAWVSDPIAYAYNVVDAFYFSASTMVTFSAGTIWPKWLVAKMFVVVQLLMGVFLAVVVLGSFFSRNNDQK